MVLEPALVATVGARDSPHAFDCDFYARMNSSTRLEKCFGTVKGGRRLSEEQGKGVCEQTQMVPTALIMRFSRSALIALIQSSSTVPGFWLAST